MEQQLNQDKTPHRVKFKTRSGTRNSGWEYETNMLTLLAIRCVRQNFRDFWLGTNVTDIGDFDDIVLYVKESSKSAGFSYFMQLKHSENANKINEKDFSSAEKGNSNFSLIKYSKNFSKLKSTLGAKSSDLIVNAIDLNSTIFVLFTNRPSEKYNCLEQDSNNRFFLLNTVSNTKHIFKFNLDQLNLTLDNADLCQNIRLFSNQSDAVKLNQLIVAELEKLCAQLGIKTLTDPTNVAEKFKAYIGFWARGELGEYFYLTKNDVVWKLSQLFSSSFLFQLKDEYSHIDDKTIQTWNDLVINKQITIVNLDSHITQFFNQCARTEVCKYIDNDNKQLHRFLSNNERELFFKNHPNLKPLILEIVGNHGRISPIDICNCLMFTGELPMVLEVRNVEAYEDILAVLKFSENSFRVIILNTLSDFTPDLNNTIGHFTALSDLNEEERTKVLSHCVDLQGRSSVLLENLMDASMNSTIKVTDIIHILSGKFNIGGQYTEYSKISEYFIQRGIAKIIFKSEIIKQLNRETFVIESELETDFNHFPSHKSVQLFDNVVTCNEKESFQRLEELKSENKKVIHRLRWFDDGLFEWKSTFGSISNIRQQQLIKSYSLYKPVDAAASLVPIYKINSFWIDVDDVIDGKKDTYRLDRSYIVTASPGMGKSTLLNYIAAKAPVNMWVLKVNLNAYEDYYKNKSFNNLKALNHLQYFNDSILEKCGCDNKELAKAVFKKFLDAKKVLVLLDSFDEISATYEDRITKIAKCLHAEGYPVWIATRPMMKMHLEKELDVISTTLKPWSQDDQETFLVDYFKYILGISNIEILKKFVERLLEAAKNNLNEKFCRFTSLPLQSKLLADVFLNDCKASIGSGIINFKEKFDLVDLYEEFVNMKTDILCSKFGKDAERTRSLFEEHQQLFALKTLFDEDSLAELNIDAQLQQYYKGKRSNIQLLQRDGFLEINYNTTSKCKFSVNFVHRTFGEYLAAVWLSINIKEDDDTIEKKVACSLMTKRFGWAGKRHYRFLFNIFDLMVCRDSPLHLDILHGRLDNVKEVIENDPQCITEVDDCERSVLHLLVQYGKPHPTHGVLNTNNFVDEVVEIIERIPGDVITNIGSDIVGYSPLCYAIASSVLAVADKICEKAGTILVKNSIDRSLRFTFCQFCVKLQYKCLFKLLLPYFSSEDILMRYIDRHTTMQTYCQVNSYNGEEHNRLVTYLNAIGVTEVSEIFQFVPYYFTELHIAIAFASDSDVESLLSTVDDIDQEDIHKNTLLHYAVIHERREIVKMLLNKNADVNKSGKIKYTALHYAAARGCDDIILDLLDGGADIHKVNAIGETALEVTRNIRHRNKSTISLLLSKGADSTLTDKERRYVLYNAVLLGDYNVVCKMLDNNLDVNQVDNSHNEIPIITATRYGHNDITRMLIRKGADCNLVNHLNEFALYWTVRRGDDDISVELLANGADIYKPCLTNGDSLLHMAVECGRLTTLELLLNHGADLNTQNHNGKTALHIAADLNFGGSTRLLLSKDVKVDIKDFYGNTPLHLALIGGYEGVAKLLLSENIDVNLEDIWGYSYLHCAVETGLKDIVLELLSQGANINKADKDGNVPLHSAFIFRRTDIAKLLMDNGANVDVENSFGNSPIHYAVYMNEKTDALVNLLAKGANINKQNKYGETPLHFALGFSATSDLLQTESRNKTLKRIGYTIYQKEKGPIIKGIPSDIFLSYSLNKNKLKSLKATVRYLIDNGADINLRQNNGLTPLHVVSLAPFENVNFSEGYLSSTNELHHINMLKFYESVARLLIRSGADCNIKDDTGLTPVDYAKMCEWNRMVNFLSKT